MNNFYFTIAILTISNILGECFCFLFTRYFLKEYLISVLKNFKYYNAIDKASKD